MDDALTTAAKPAKETDASPARDIAQVVQVLLPLPLGQAYDYALPEGLEAEAGDLVRVPLGPRHVTGLVVGPGAGDVAPEKLKPVLAREAVPRLSADHLEFLRRVAAWTLSWPGQVLRMTLNAREALTPPKGITAYRAASTIPDDLRLSDARRRVLEVASAGYAMGASDLAREAGCSTGVVKGLAQAGALETIQQFPAFPGRIGARAGEPATLSPEQQAAADALCAKIDADRFSVTLLDGVTGSGKTEVYFEAVEQAILRGRQALVLLPEIALSEAFIERFRKRFGAEAALWHSGLSAGQRALVWRGVLTGETKVVIGARSALFLPFADPGLIVVDEEHEAAYKQEDGVAYQGRDMAVLRGAIGAFPVVLVSATPSLETRVNVQRGRYGRIDLPRRHGVAQLPRVSLIDMREYREDAAHFISAPLRERIAETLAADEQVLLFLNRRGYAPLTLCRTCGHRMQCPDCTAWVVEHRLTGRLHCHHCGWSSARVEHCPECHAPDSMVACGPGVERISEEVRALFPEARQSIMTSDLVRGTAALREVLADIHDRRTDIIIGTQMVAKGHTFPGLTLVGIVDADLGLSGGDLRAGERSWQLLHQVAGRAGRTGGAARVLVQTFMPEHRVMQALVAHDRDEFMAIEADEREEAGMPPFGRLGALIVSGVDEARVQEAARNLARAAPHGTDIEVLGPALAPLARLRGRHRMRFLVKAGLETRLQPVIARWLNAVKLPPKVRVAVDIDPYSFL